MIDRKHRVIIFLLMITIFVSWNFYFHDYQHKDTVNINNFPSSIDTWNSQDLPIDQSDLAVLKTNNAFLRKYTDDRGRHVYLYVVYSQTSLAATNPPEILYDGLGISVIDKGRKYITIASSNLSFKVNWLLLDNNENQQMAYYWFKVGDVYTHSYWKERFLAAFNNIVGRKTGNALIRISTDVENGHQKEAINLINEFACLIIPQLFKNLP